MTVCIGQSIDEVCTGDIIRTPNVHDVALRQDFTMSNRGGSSFNNLLNKTPKHDR